MALTPEQFAKLQAIVAQHAQAPQGGIQQAQGAPMPMQGMSPQQVPQVVPQAPPMAVDQREQAKKAIMAKVAALPPQSQAIFKQKLQELAAKSKKV